MGDLTSMMVYGAPGFLLRSTPKIYERRGAMLHAKTAT